MYEVKRFTIGFPFPEAYAVLGDRGWVLFDSGTLGTRENLTSLFEDAGVDLKRVALIVITHAHTDHYSNAAILKELTQAPLVCHRNAAPVLAAGGNVPIIPVNVQGETLVKNDGALGERLGINPFGIPLPVVADLVFDDVFDLRPYGLDGELIYTPGHTLCSICAVLKTGQTICGDTIVYFDGHPWFGVFSENGELHEASGKSIIAVSDILYMGHGGACSARALDGVAYASRAGETKCLLEPAGILMPEFLK